MVDRAAIRLFFTSSLNGLDSVAAVVGPGVVIISISFLLFGRSTRHCEKAFSFDLATSSTAAIDVDGRVKLLLIFTYNCLILDTILIIVLIGYS